MADVIIVGSGIAAQAAGHRLQQEGWKVTLLDKARGVGGRMATRVFGGATFDHGAQFFTVRSNVFAETVNRWQHEGLVEPWFQTAQGKPDRHFRYRGKPSMTAIARHFDEAFLAVVRQVKVVRLARIDGVWRVDTEDERTFFARGLILTPPLPQALGLVEPLRDLIDPGLWDELASVRYTKTLTAMLRLDRPSALPEPGYLQLEDPEPLMTLVDNQQKGISDVPAVTLHSGPAFAERYWDTPDEARQALLVEAAAPLLQAEVIESQIHRWGYATCLNPLERPCAGVSALNLWFAGDGFGAARIEAAFLSGHEAAIDATVRLRC